jgi:hypothetical protein
VAENLLIIFKTNIRNFVLDPNLGPVSDEGKSAKMWIKANKSIGQYYIVK